MMGLDARILAALRASEVYLPATDLATQLRVTLPTIEARLKELRAAGFEIEERPGLGFLFLRSPDRLIADDIFSRLGTCELAREIVVFTETASTNDSAMQRGRQGSEGGIVIFAESQTAGRGRFGRAWASAPHRGLWFSMLMRPELPPSAWPRLTTWAAVSLASTIENSLGLPAAIKWPNDIYLSGRKIAGILAESGADVNGRPFAVVGIGVNVNQTQAEFPPELADKAASLSMVTGHLIDRPTFAAHLLRELGTRLPRILTDFPAMIDEARRRSLLLGHWVQVQSGHNILEGRAEELDADGQLLLRRSDGTLSRLSAGEVTIIPS